MLNLVEWVHSDSLLANPDTEATRTLPVRTFAARALSRLRRKVKEGGLNLRGMDDEARHELRKDAKKLRYAAEFFALLFDGKGEKAKQKNFIIALEAVQDELGALNDLATAPMFLTAWVSPTIRKRQRCWQGARKRLLSRPLLTRMAISSTAAVIGGDDYLDRPPNSAAMPQA